ncbi:unnamed protein product [Caenorhabditis nigoni]
MGDKTPPRDHSKSTPPERSVSNSSDKENRGKDEEQQHAKSSKKEKSKAQKRLLTSGDHSSGTPKRPSPKRPSKDHEELHLPEQGPFDPPPTPAQVRQQVLTLEDLIARKKCEELEDRVNTIAAVVQELVTSQSARDRSWEDRLGNLTDALGTTQAQLINLMEAIQKNTDSGTRIVEVIYSKPILNTGMTSLEVVMAEIKNIQDSIMTTVSGIQKSIGKMELQKPSADKTILAKAETYASVTKGMASPVEGCILCKKSNHSILQCGGFTSPIDRFHKATENGVCLSCLELYDRNPKGHQGCSATALVCNRCTKSNVPEPWTHHHQLFCLKKAENKKGKGNHQAAPKQPPQ